MSAFLEKMQNALRSRITTDPERLNGKSHITKTNILVEDVARHIQDGTSIDDILTLHPELVRNDIIAVIAFSET